MVLYTDEDAEEGSCRGAEFAGSSTGRGRRESRGDLPELGSANRPFAPGNENMPLWGYVNCATRMPSHPTAAAAALRPRSSSCTSPSRHRRCASILPVPAPPPRCSSPPCLSVSVPHHFHFTILPLCHVSSSPSLSLSPESEMISTCARKCGEGQRY